MHSNNELQFIFENDVLRLFRIKPATLAKWRNERGFPQPVTKRPKQYSVTSIKKWVEQQSLGGAL